MKVVILAGGTQSTIVDEREGLPKPMATIGEKPILWHIMKIFSAQGFHDFVICGGYKVNLIKDYFLDYYIYQSDITVDLETNCVQIHKKKTENWNVTVVDTGINTTPGNRILQVKEYIGEEDFILVHGDCVFDIDVNRLVEIHYQNRKIATLTLAHPTGRNSVLSINRDGEMLNNYEADLPENQAWVNACCKVLNSRIYTYLDRYPDLGTDLFGNLAVDSQLITYKHPGFWSPVETKRDCMNMQRLWSNNEAPWKIWQ